MMIKSSFKKSISAVFPFWMMVLVCSCQSPKQKADEQKPSIIEMVYQDTSEATINQLKALLKQDEQLFRWKTHFIVFGKDIHAALSDSLKMKFPEAELKHYDDLFYEFNRSYCADTVHASEWEHSILTANLVADTALQKEYLQYHATQFQEWPEVSKGFCDASFQQLLLFKNGRQLMLVISIPKGKSLDELNPKTTENNPRVNEWNKLMSKYQEGITGTAEGKTWVFFNGEK
ncbi:L-rhamnose mutarotase [Pedobacter glucosidilyticus]|uniref:L-rhamnose mutarotase n=1 Tax=Pedobacter glucosidilyticus TaxID=1122941 RepID=UPI0026E9F1D0|nr:L-rhamnose mutarotase [Pedobacter glucosidilyticus]